MNPLSRRTVRWRSVEGEGLEHLVIGPHDGGVRADSVVIGERGGIPYGVRYRIDCDARWHISGFSVETTAGERLALLSDGRGHWRNEAGDALPQFDNCIDIDLAGTPFTNTIPIRRLGLTPQSETAKLTMLYVPFDRFEPFRDGQNYTCLEAGRLYRYQAEDRSFSADLPVDEDGLVIDYPGLFERLKA
ncbi:transcriptional regulator [Phyllobacterium salinisoli]|uniref:Transcriptional regulator n=1 Tax=Phyllobacterium salinisoli TaxID=1899321 RepID=A0A368K4W6_9HYPH|nr:putative glycolipid-binding domain-containing protein [Phyllobacterium salinisoli]RCS23685.1 transcriptional regulator [Phyllobacterium salinisoli]